MSPTRNIKRQSVICIDDATAYYGVGGYERLSVNHGAKEYVNGTASTNGIESVWAARLLWDISPV